MDTFSTVRKCAGHTCRTNNIRKPWLLEIRSSTWFITFTIATAVFVDIFLYAVIVPVFPFSLVDRLHIHEDDVQQWMSILFSMEAIGLLVAAPIFGYISDHFANRKRPMLGGMIVLAAATLMLCFARSLPLLIVGRLLQGASAGVVWVVGLALLADTVGPTKIGQYMGYVAMANSIAALLAPLLGGLVYEKAGYYAVFGMGCGMIVLDLILRILLVEKTDAKAWTSVEHVGPQRPPSDEKAQGQTYTTNLQARRMTCGTTDSATDSTTDEIASIASTNSSMPGSTSGILAKQTQDALVIKKVPPFLVLLKSRRMQAAFLVNTMDAMMLTAFDVTLPLFVEQTFGWKALGGGLAFLALLSPSFIQPLYGKLIDKHGPRLAAIVGILVCIPPWVCLRFVIHNTIPHKVLLCSLLFLLGLGAHLTLAATMTEFTCIASEKERKQPGSMGSGGAYAQSYSLFNMSWATGSLIGSYFAGGIREHAGWGTMGWSYAVLCAVVSVPTLLYCGGWIGDEKKQRLERKQLRDIVSSSSRSLSTSESSSGRLSV